MSVLQFIVSAAALFRQRQSEYDRRKYSRLCSSVVCFIVSSGKEEVLTEKNTVLYEKRCSFMSVYLSGENALVFKFVFIYHSFIFY